ncbi:MAG: LytTR family DNA-binding domain-containing protein [Crocinitomicaceae bacterium]
MKSYSCVIIEDEFPAIEILKGYLSNFENWTILAIFKDPLEAMQFLQKNSVDAIFLDIQLPKLNGLELLESIKKPPLVIITSAYQEHAVKAFELVVFDYLLKPYSFSRFVQTINRIHEKTSETSPKPFISVRENRNNVRINLDEISYIESQREYILILHGEAITKTKIPIARIQEMLPEKDFVRIHRSFIVSIDKITQFNQNQIDLQGRSLPIGRMYKSETLKKISDIS